MSYGDMEKTLFDVDIRRFFNAAETKSGTNPVLWRFTLPAGKWFLIVGSNYCYANTWMHFKRSNATSIIDFIVSPSASVSVPVIFTSDGSTNNVYFSCDGSINGQMRAYVFGIRIE
jgi:hypothetical protein